MPQCSEGTLLKELACPSCGKHAVTVLNDSCYQCCGVHGGCGYVSLMKEEFMSFPLSTWGESPFDTESLTTDEVQIIHIYCDEKFLVDKLNQNNKYIKGLREEPNRSGVFGECALNKWLGKSVEQTLKDRPIRRGDGGCDIVIDNRRWDGKLQVSATPPTLEFFCNIPALTLKHNNPPYGYIFTVKQLDKYDKFWIMGFMTKLLFEYKSTFHKEGSTIVDEKGRPFTYRNDTYGLPVKNLAPLPRRWHQSFKLLPR